MKKLLLWICFFYFLLAANAQQVREEGSAAAKTAFAAKFPAAQKVKWSMEKPGEFEVEFTLNKVESSALFDAAGKLLETEIEIGTGELPSTTKAILERDFAGFKLDEIEKSTDARGVITYEMEAAKGKIKLALCFDTNGQLKSREPLKKGKD